MIYSMKYVGRKTKGKLVSPLKALKENQSHLSLGWDQSKSNVFLHTSGYN